MLKKIKEEYKKLYGKDLEAAVKGEVSGDLERLLVSLLQCNRSENNHPNDAQCAAKAKELFEAGEGQWGTDESAFNKIFATSSPMELALIARHYHKLAGKTILEAINKEFGGNMKKLLNTIVYAIISPSEYFATRVKAAIKGFGTNDSLLIRVLITRDEIDMPQIKQYYKQLYGNDMIVSSETAISMINPSTLVVIVDVNRPSMTECEELLSLAKSVVVFDHHRQTNELITNATLSYIEPFASSACEMVAEMLQYVGEQVQLKPIEADAMYSGIVIDTDNFLTKTGVRTFEAASYLRRCGADVVRVRKMFRNDITSQKQLAEGIINAQIYLDCFAISIINPLGVESPTVVAAKVANDLLDVDGIRASFVVTEKDGTTYISARSVDDINVQIIMEKMGGGGHANIAGAQLIGENMDTAISKIKELLEKMFREGDI